MRRADYIPQPSRHRTGNAVVRLNGVDCYLGPFGSAEARRRYDALIATWIANGRQLPEAERTINDLILAYLRHAEVYYQDSPKEREKIRLTVRPLTHLYGKTPVGQFSPTRLKAVRQRMLEIQRRAAEVRDKKSKAISRRVLEYRLCRRTINQRIGVLKRMFKWGVEDEIVPSFIYQAVDAVSGLKEGRSTARESRKVKPVSEAQVDATLPKVNRYLQAMVQLQRLTGARSGEICCMTGGEIERGGEVNGVPLWTYRPTKHKNTHRGASRTIFLGPRVIEVIRPFLTADPTAYLFSPRRAMEEHYAVLRAPRKSKVPPSQRRRKKTNPERRPGERYTTHSYRKAVYSAAKKAGVEPWQPHQLRHAAATYLRKMYGVELARIILGHATAFTTEIYAEADRLKAMEAMSRIG